MAQQHGRHHDGVGGEVIAGSRGRQLRRTGMGVLRRRGGRRSVQACLRRGGHDVGPAGEDRSHNGARRLASMVPHGRAGSPLRQGSRGERATRESAACARTCTAATMQCRTPTHTASSDSSERYGGRKQNCSRRVSCSITASSCSASVATKRQAATASTSSLSMAGVEGQVCAAHACACKQVCGEWRQRPAMAVASRSHPVPPPPAAVPTCAAREG